MVAARLDARGAHELGVLVALEGREEVGQARRDERRPAPRSRGNDSVPH